jgi:hypothetical protein
MQKLIENIQFFNKESVESVDDGAHYTNTMSFDRV